MRRGLIHSVELAQKEFENAKALIACVELQEVRLSRFKFISSLDDRSQPDGQIEISSTSRSNPTIAGSAFRISFDLGLQGHQEGILIIDITARIEAIYSVPEDKTFSAAQMKAFSRSNGMLNIWPYWREYVQAATQRAGLAPLTLPLFRVRSQPAKLVHERR